MTELLRNSLETIRNIRKNKNRSGIDIHKQRLEKTHKKNKHST